MDSFLIDLAKVVRQYGKDDDIVKIHIKDVEYFFISYGEKVNVQVIDKKSRMCDYGWWLLANDEVYAFEGH